MAEGYLDNLEFSTLKKLESALGKLGWQRHAIPNYSLLVSPAEKFKVGLRKWDSEGKKSVETNRELTPEELKLVSKTIQILKDAVRPLTLFKGKTDTYHLQTYVTKEGGYISVSEDIKLPPNLYLNHRFQGDELRFSNVEKEVTLLWRAYETVMAIAAGKAILVHTTESILKEMKKGTDSDKAFNSRWGKWTMMKQDSQWNFQLSDNTKPTINKSNQIPQNSSALGGGQESEVPQVRCTLPHTTLSATG